MKEVKNKSTIILSNKDGFFEVGDMGKCVAFMEIIMKPGDWLLQKVGSLWEYGIKNTIHNQSSLCVASLASLPCFPSPKSGQIE